MSATDRLDQIEARVRAATALPRSDVTSNWCQWVALKDAPALVAALQAVLDEIDKRKHTTGGRLTLADVLPKIIEEKLK